MPKRKITSVDNAAKKQRTGSEENPPESVNITSNPTQSHTRKENPPWSASDIRELLQKIEEKIPPDDHLPYNSRLDQIDWENIKIKNYSTQECKDTWSDLYKTVRKFRYLREIIGDLKDGAKAERVPRKHTGKPRQPPNSFMLFAEESRETAVRKNADPHPNDILKQMFRNLPLEERESYNQRAKAARDEYFLKLQKYYEQHPGRLPKNKIKGDDNEQPEGAPLEKPPTPFELYLKAESKKEDAPTFRFLIMQKCREQWDEFGDKEKFFWINWAEELYCKYVVDLKEYMKKHPDYEPAPVKDVLTKKEQQIKRRWFGKPDEPPHGPYELFTKMMLENDEVRRRNGNDLMNYVSERWRSCSDDAKNEYKARVEQMWENYRKKLEDYLLTLSPVDRDRVREEESRKKKTGDEVSETKREEVVKAAMAKPQPPPATAHAHFVDVDAGDGDANAVWKDASEDERGVFKATLDGERRKNLTGNDKDVDEVHNMVDDIADQQHLADEISSAISNGDVGEDEFKKERKALEEEEAFEEKLAEVLHPHELPAVPAAGIAKPNPAKSKIEDMTNWNSGPHRSGDNQSQSFYILHTSQ